MALHTDLRALRVEVGELVASHGQTRSLSAFAKHAGDPVGFILDELHADPVMFWSRQREIAELVRDNPYVVVRSANGIGKDWLAARLALWWVYCRRGYVLITGPTERQVKGIVMGQVRRAFAAAAHLPGQLFELALRLDGTEEMGILAFTSTESNRLTGFHAPRLMVLITEAQGIEPAVWEAMFACSTGGDSRILAVGNPLQPEGKFFEVSRSPTWSSMKISALEHPNIVQQREVIPGAVTQAFINLMCDEYGVGSGVYGSRVLSEFPDEADDTLCQRRWILAANDRWHASRGKPPQGTPELALDPARYGVDHSVLAVRYEDRIDEFVSWSKLDTVATAGQVVAEMERRGIPHRDDTRYVLTVDEPGLGGGVIDVLREMRVKVVPFNGGATPVGIGADAKFRNLRAESYWNVRRRLERGTIGLPVDAKLADELCSMRWKVALDGKVELEGKDQLRQRLGRSPDRADALAMVFATDLKWRPPIYRPEDFPSIKATY